MNVKGMVGAATLCVGLPIAGGLFASSARTSPRVVCPTSSVGAEPRFVVINRDFVLGYEHDGLWSMVTGRHGEGARAVGGGAHSVIVYLKDHDPERRVWSVAEGATYYELEHVFVIASDEYEKGAAATHAVGSTRAQNPTIYNKDYFVSIQVDGGCWADAEVVDETTTQECSVDSDGCSLTIEINVNGDEQCWEHHGVIAACATGSAGWYEIDAAAELVTIHNMPRIPCQ